MTRFSELPDDIRFAARNEIDALGGYVSMYTTNGVQVAMPNDGAKEYAIELILKGLGHKLVSSCYFPLGSDAPEQHLRHRCPTYQSVTDRPGYWLYSTFAVPGEDE